MKVLALAGGVGGAKLCLGLARALPGDSLRIVVNTGDDEDFYGLRVCPDMDTVMYTLAGMSNPETGWGIAGESFTTLSALERIGQDPWFKLGDQDIATHIVRSDILRRGGTLSQATDYLRRWLGVERPIIPMSDDRVRTMVETDAGTLPFQTYFVKLRCEPRVSDIRFEGADGAAMSPGFSESLDECDVLVVCPSNPYLRRGADSVRAGRTGADRGLQGGQGGGKPDSRRGGAEGARREAAGRDGGGRVLRGRGAAVRRVVRYIRSGRN